MGGHKEGYLAARSCRRIRPEGGGDLARGVRIRPARGAPEDGEDEEQGDEEDEDVGHGNRLHVRLRHRSA
jgi:hypothetical protein